MILDKIVQRTRQRIKEQKQIISIEEIKPLALALASQPHTPECIVTTNSQYTAIGGSECYSHPNPDTCNPLSTFPFERALKSLGMSFICEVKKASPSKGIIAHRFPYLDIAREYESAGAAAISVLTEPDFFLGSDIYLSEIKQQVAIPVLRKDFIIDEYQIYQSKLIGADAILLICSLLDTSTLSRYIELADSLGLSCLVEAHSQEEVESALAAKARIIGINNRNLQTFEVDINTSISLRKYIPDNIIFVSESGISTLEDIRKLCDINASAVLIGEAFMRSHDISQCLSQLKGALTRN